jgi:hypothetical protein
MIERTLKLVVLYLTILFLGACTKKNRIQEPRKVTENGKTYLVQDSILIDAKNGTQLHLIVVRNAEMTKPSPAVLLHTIYTRKNDIDRAKMAADYGYVGVISYSRGKGLSPDSIIPYKYEARDTYEVIDWISTQKWSNRKIGMYGGSYAGFTQWAAVKHKIHPALKTIVPAVAAAPGIAEPMENGVHQNFHFPWHHYVTNSKYLDTTLYFNHKRWQDLNMRWYAEGVAYKNIDSLDGLSNPQFKERLLHPTYDNYWQKMMPYQEDFAHIDIPVLATTGYYDGGQIGTQYYLKQHLKFNENAEHYLVIGPYSHFGAQSKPNAKIYGYEIDPVAQINITELIFEWFDYILKGKAKPLLLKDNINYQVMEANQWGHASSLGNMANDTLKFHLKNRRSGAAFKSAYDTGNNGKNVHYTLSENLSEPYGFLEQTIDFADRSNLTWNSSSWANIVDDVLTVGQGFSFATEPFDHDFELNGSFDGNLYVTVNKKDFDYSVSFYEQTSGGKFFALTLPYVGRASYVKNWESRTLLTPNVKTKIPFGIVRMTSKKIKKGSRLVIVVNGIKEPFTEINYGTGKPVSEENIQNAKLPLHIKWHNESYIHIPVKKK